MDCSKKVLLAPAMSELHHRGDAGGVGMRAAFNPIIVISLELG